MRGAGPYGLSLWYCKSDSLVIAGSLGLVSAVAKAAICGTGGSTVPAGAGWKSYSLIDRLPPSAAALVMLRVLSIADCGGGRSLSRTLDFGCISGSGFIAGVRSATSVTFAHSRSCCRRGYATAGGAQRGKCNDHCLGWGSEQGGFESARVDPPFGAYLPFCRVKRIALW